MGFFHDYKLSIEIDENEHNNRIIDDEIKGQKVIEQQHYNWSNFDIVEAINEIFRHIKQMLSELTEQWTKKTIGKISMRFLRLELKAIKCIIKKYCLIMCKVVPKTTMP